MSEMDDTANNPLVEFSIKLCAVVKKEKCLHDRTSVHKYTTPDIEAAWDRVAKECSESIEYCKYRWKSMCKSFFRNYKRCNHYYLHDHMLFLKENDQQHTINEDTNSVDKFNDDVSRQESEFDPTQLDEDRGSESDSQTASADEITINDTVKVKHMFLSEENERDIADMENFVKRKRSNRERACKRGLDPKLVRELAEEGLEEKRPRRSLEKPKILTSLKEKGPTIKVDNRSLKVKLSNKISYPGAGEVKRESIDAFNMHEGSKMVDTSTNTDIQYRHTSTQYDVLKGSLNQFDEIFINTVATQLSKMNGRQKMNFKSKIYQSLMDVFDDATDFPNTKESIQVQPKAAPLLLNTTTGELRLMRELVSLVQAAKSTPEVVMSKEKVTATTLDKTANTTKTASGNKAADAGFNSELGNIPLDDEDDSDIQLPIDNLDEEEDVHLPRSLDEIMVKPADNREPNKGHNLMGLPKHVLQKVVKVAGSNGSTIVARDGDKRRIYRIYPKSVNQLDNRLMVNKNPSSVGTFFVAPSRGGTSANNSALNKTSSNASTIHVKNISNNTAKVSNAYATPTGSNANQNGHAITTKRVNSPALYKSIHPANRILNATTGLFQTGANTNSSSPPLTASNNTGKPAQVSALSSGGETGGTYKTTTKFVPLQSTMLPPNSNAGPGYSSSKKPIQVRASQQSPQIIQRRFSICGPLPVEKTNNSPNPTQANNKINKSPNSSTSQIQISKPVSLNKQAYNLLNSNDKEQILGSISKASTTPNNGINNPTPTKAITSKEQEELPIMETAGTITADSLDPLYVKQTPIKSEPIDD